MVTLFFIIFLLLTVFFHARCKKEARRENADLELCSGYLIVVLISGIVSIILLIWGVILINKLGTVYIIDNKIEMYEKENDSIEKNINIILKNYMDVGELEEEEAINLISIIPELKSDAFIYNQIEVYNENNEKINELKEEKIDLVKLKWKLYFGKN